MIEKVALKRYAIIVQHEVIVYSYDEEMAKNTALRAYAAKPKCIHIKELPPVEVEAIGNPVIDHRTAPGT